MLLLFISLILVATGVTFSILFETLALQIIGGGLTIVGVAMILVYYIQLLNTNNAKWKNQKKSLETQMKKVETDYNEQISQLNKQLADKDKEIEQLRLQLKHNSKPIPELPSDLILEQRLAKIRSYFEDQTGFDYNYRRFFSELNNAVKNHVIRININENLTRPLMEKLSGMTHPLDDASKQELLSDLVQLALVEIDYTQSYRSTFNGEDSIALRMASGKISAAEAAGNANKANTNIYETEMSLRVLQALFHDLNLSDKTLIVHDTLL